MIEKVSPQLVQESFRALELLSFFELFYFLTRQIKIIMTFLVRDAFEGCSSLSYSSSFQVKKY